MGVVVWAAEWGAECGEAAAVCSDAGVASDGAVYVVEDSSDSSDDSGDEASGVYAGDVVGKCYAYGAGGDVGSKGCASKSAVVSSE